MAQHDGRPLPPIVDGRPLPPIVFLDVDGVLHPTHNGETFFQPACMRNLRSIIEATGAVIVLSSSWQAHEAGRADVNEVLKRWGIPPFVAHTVAHGQVGAGEERRAREIMAWIGAHRMACSSGWIIIDDLSLDRVANPPSFSPLVPPGRLIKVSDAVGLTQQDANLAITALGGRNPKAPPLPAPQQNATEPIYRPGVERTSAGRGRDR